jgi:hypothetical protein
MALETVEMRVVTLTNPRFVAVALCHDYLLYRVKRGTHAAQVAFDIAVAPDRSDDFDQLMVLCEQKLAVPLPGGIDDEGRHLPLLGDYEKHFRDVMRQIEDYNKENGHE